jgi:anti-anti-sigma regulatory factor
MADLRMVHAVSGLTLHVLCKTCISAKSKKGDTKMRRHFPSIASR